MGEDDISNTEDVNSLLEPVQTLQKQNVWLNILLLIVVGAAVFVPRVANIGQYVTIDEVTWIVYGGNFYYALGQREFEQTYQREHPAVPLYWAATGAFLVEFPEYRGLGQGYLEGFKKTANYYRTQGVDPLDLLKTARIFMVIGNTILMMGAFWMARKLVGVWPALVGFLLIAFDPFHITHTQIVHVDGFLGSCMFFSVVAFLGYLYAGRKPRYLVLAGAGAGLAWVTRAISLFLLPFFGLLLLVAWLVERRESDAKGKWPAGFWKRIMLPLVWLSLAGAGVFVVLWPAMWVAPIQTLQRMLEKILFYSASGGTSLNVFFAGEIYTHVRPSVAFYPITFLWRTTPVILLGLLAAVIGARWPSGLTARKGVRQVMLGLALFAALYTVYITIPARVFDRYLHPVYAPLDLLAGIGLMGVVSRLGSVNVQAIRRYGAAVVLALLVAIQLGSALVVYPYPISYYNPLLGGLREAPEVMMVGWGEGLDQVGRYLRAKPDGDSLRVMSWYGTGPLSFYLGDEYQIYTLDVLWSRDANREYTEADYAVLYVNQVQRQASQELTDYLTQFSPEHVVTINGLEYAWVYNLHDFPLPAFIPPEFR
jgi:4-amino-4-deoxy-L-arabinose transferase-like glycosyltransferase